MTIPSFVIEAVQAAKSSSASEGMRTTQFYAIVRQFDHQ